MSITAIYRDFNETPNIVRVTATDTLATVAAADYVTTQTDNLATLNSGTWEWLTSDIILVSATDGQQFFQFDGDDFTTFIQLPGGNGEVTLPVVDGDFTMFDGTLGALKDLGFSASNPAKTKVVMAGSAVQSGYLAHFVDTAGTIDDTAAAVINAGTVQSGLSGTAGGFIAYPATAANGFLELLPVNAGAAFNTIISNSVMGQTSTISIPDPGAGTAQFLVKNAAFVSGNVVVASGTAGLTVDSGFPNTGLVQVASVAITAAQFNGMYAAPKLLIAAPGANNLIIVDKIALIMTFVSAAYAAGGVVGFQYDATVHGAGVAATNVEAAADFFAAASTTFQFNGVAGNTVAIAPFTTTVNKGLYLSNLTQPFTTGDGTWIAKIYYRIVAVA